MQESTTDAQRNRAEFESSRVREKPVDATVDHHDDDDCGASPTTVSDEILGSFTVDKFTKYNHMSIMGL